MPLEAFNPAESYANEWRHRPEAYEAEYWPHLASGEPDGPGVTCRAEIDRSRSDGDQSQIATAIMASTRTAAFLIWADGSSPEPAPGFAMRILQGPHAGWWTFGAVTRARYGPRWQVDAYGVPRASNDTE